MDSSNCYADIILKCESEVASVDRQIKKIVGMAIKRNSSCLIINRYTFDHICTLLDIKDTLHKYAQYLRSYKETKDS